MLEPDFEQSQRCLKCLSLLGGGDLRAEEELLDETSASTDNMGDILLSNLFLRRNVNTQLTSHALSEFWQSGVSKVTMKQELLVLWLSW